MRVALACVPSIDSEPVPGGWIQARRTYRRPRGQKRELAAAEGCPSTKAVARLTRATATTTTTGTNALCEIRPPSPSGPLASSGISLPRGTSGAARAAASPAGAWEPSSWRCVTGNNNELAEKAVALAGKRLGHRAAIVGSRLVWRRRRWCLARSFLELSRRSRKKAGWLAGRPSNRYGSGNDNKSFSNNRVSGSWQVCATERAGGWWKCSR